MKNYYYTIPESEYNKLSDEVKQMFTETNTETKEEMSKEVKDWLKGKQDEIARNNDKSKEFI